MGRKGNRNKNKKAEEPKKPDPEPVVEEIEEIQPKQRKPNKKSNKKSKGKKGRGKNSNNGSKPKKTKSNRYAPKKDNFFADNWKVIVPLGLLLGVIIFMKANQEMFSMNNMGYNKQLDKDLYKVIGVSRSATTEDIKAAFKKKAKELHPDRNPDCKDCQEKFSELGKAHEILGNQEKRKFYDKFNGVLNIIKSSAINLTGNNFDPLVVDGNDIWIIMVYLDNDELSKVFTGFFDEVAKQYPFVKFGRINYSRQQALLSNLPFKVEEIPFFLNYDKYGNSEFLEFDAEREGKTAIKKFVRNSIGKHYSKTDYSVLEKIVKAENQSIPTIIYVDRSYIPTAFNYLGYKLENDLNIHTTKFGEHKDLYKLAGQNNVDYLIRLPDGLKYEGKNTINIKFPIKESKKEETHLNTFTLAKFLIIPEIGRNSFNEYCTDITAGADDTHKKSVCVLALKTTDDDDYKEILTTFKEQQNHNLPTFVEKTRELSENIFEFSKTIQFAQIDVNRHKKLKALLTKISPIQNPRVMIYISGQNKIQFFNNPDDVVDAVDDLVAGEAEGFSHFKVMTDSELTLDKYLVPDSLSFFTLLWKQLKIQLFSFFNMVLATAVTVCGVKYLAATYQQMGIVVGAACVFLAFVSAIAQSFSYGIF